MNKKHHSESMKKALFVLIALLVGYLVWSNIGKGFDKPQSFKIDSFENYTDSTNRSNIVGIQPFMEVGDYATEGRFQQKIQFFRLSNSQQLLSLLMLLLLCIFRKCL